MDHDLTLLFNEYFVSCKVCYFGSTELFFNRCFETILKCVFLPGYFIQLFITFYLIEFQITNYEA